MSVLLCRALPPDKFPLTVANDVCSAVSPAECSVGSITLLAAKIGIQVHAVDGGVTRHGTHCGGHGSGENVHGTDGLPVSASGLNMAWPLDCKRYTNATFVWLEFVAVERNIECVTCSSVVSDEENECVVVHTLFFQYIENASDAVVE